MSAVPQSQSQSSSRGAQTQVQGVPVRVPGDRWRLQVVHRSELRYGGPVRSSYNEARMTPENSSRQTTLRSRVEIEPTATVHAYRDYWGSTVTAFDTHGPHTELVVKATSVVEAGPEPHLPDPVDWAALAEPDVLDRFGEFLRPSRLTAMDEPVVAAVREVVGDAGPREAGRLACRFVYDLMEYLTGSTNVKTNAMQAWTAGKGVCQDISHVTVGLLRALGLPARYVSGYLHPGPRSPNTTVTGESHSWIEWWCGTWVAYDPTMGRRLTDSYVRVGHGRDYGDVAPLRGTYSGGGSSMFVTVAMTELG